jgi:hypothetical protein
MSMVETLLIVDMYDETILTMDAYEIYNIQIEIVLVHNLAFFFWST